MKPECGGNPALSIGCVRRLLLIVVMAANANFLVFCIVAFLIGGDALNGKEEGGHYFLANHERLTDVSHRLFRYSLWHARSVLVTYPLGMLAGWLWLRKRNSK